MCRGPTRSVAGSRKDLETKKNLGVVRGGTTTILSWRFSPRCLFSRRGRDQGRDVTSDSVGVPDTSYSFCRRGKAGREGSRGVLCVPGLLLRFTEERQGTSVPATNS